MRSDLVSTLNNLYHDRLGGRMPMFDNVVIETSGLAEPGPVLQAFLSEPTLDGLFRVGRVLTLVDGVNWPDTSAEHDEAVRQVAARHLREVAGRQCLQREAGASGAQRKLVALARCIHFHLGAFRQLADDVVKRVRGRRRAAVGRDRRGHGFDHGKIHVGRRQPQLAARCIHLHVGQDRDGVAPFDHALHVIERFQERGALDGQPHHNILSFCPPPRGAEAGPGNENPPRAPESAPAGGGKLAERAPSPSPIMHGLGA